ncbi:MAG: hypothetical protein EON92_03460 [Burkholderiales bacterium]|nr:MAG: hypothetical protein EON92_03460 [Burkholderiales bacterium]
MMAMTLIEAAKINSGDVIRAAVIEMFARESDLLMAMPFETIAGNAYKYTLEGSLPGVGFRGVNEAFAESTGILNPTTEALAIAGGDMDVDRFIVQTQGERVRSTHEAMKIKALAAAITQKIIKGDSSINPREFDGWQRRVQGSQVISAGATAGGAALSLAALDEAIDAVDGPTALVMSKAMRRKFTVASRDSAVSGNVQFGLDQFGRRQVTYNDLPMLVAYDANGGDDILPFEEAAASGAATASSIYVVAFGEGKVVGLQNGDMDVRDMGELQAAPVYRTRVEWFVSQAVMHGRALARIRNIGNLAIVK